jgi:hypothetical protein
MEIVHSALLHLKKLLSHSVAVVTVGVLSLFCQLSQAAPYSQVVDLGQLDGGDLIDIAGVTPKKDAYLFTLALDGSIAVNAETVDFKQLVHKIALWDESGNGTQLAKGEDIQSLDLTAGTQYKIVVSGGNRAYNGAITVARYAPEVPIPASAWLFGSALLGVVLGKKRLSRK